MATSGFFNDVIIVLLRVWCKIIVSKRRELVVILHVLTRLGLRIIQARKLVTIIAKKIKVIWTAIAVKRINIKHKNVFKIGKNYATENFK